MTGLALILGAAIAVVFTECLVRSLGPHAWLSCRLREAHAALCDFRAATDDDERQRRLMDAGMRTLAVSSLALVGIAALALLAALPPLVLEWNERLWMLYAASAGACSILWWMLRARWARNGQAGTAE